MAKSFQLAPLFIDRERSLKHTVYLLCICVFTLLVLIVVQKHICVFSLPEMCDEFIQLEEQFMLKSEYARKLSIILYSLLEIQKTYSHPSGENCG